MQLSTYLSFDGNCREAFSFYEQCLGAQVVAMMTFGESPACDQTPEESRDKIMHGCLQLGENLLMGTDATPGCPHRSISGAHMVVSVPDPGDAERVFEDLSRDGSVEMPMQETFWARRFGMTVDRFGVPWMVNCEREA